MPLNTSTTYHAPPPPPVAIFFCPHTCCKNVYRDEGVILSHICWGPGAPSAGPRPPPGPSPPPRLEIGWKVGGSRRTARCYAPPVVRVSSTGGTEWVSRPGSWLGQGSFRGGGWGGGAEFLEALKVPKNFFGLNYLTPKAPEKIVLPIGKAPQRGKSFALRAVHITSTLQTPNEGEKHRKRVRYANRPQEGGGMWHFPLYVGLSGFDLTTSAR